MTPKHFNCLLIADFTVDPLAHFLQDRSSEPWVKCEIAPIDQVKQTLQDHGHECWRQKPDLTVIWSQPWRQIAGFAQFVSAETADLDSIKREVSEFSAYIRMASSLSHIVFVPSWTLPSYYRGQGVLDYKNSIGIYNTLMRMNLQLADELDDCENVYILNTQQWMSAAARTEDDRMWYLGKILFSRELFRQAAEEIKAGMQTIYGNAKKLLVLDLDNTLWGGIIGDAGVDGIKLGVNDPIGEAFIEFQRHIRILKNRGILLAIASKNDEEIALEVFEKHPEMILKKEDFVAWRINWEDKAKNIVDLVAELNLGLQSVVFIDDNPAERARVAEALPEVTVPDWPEDPVSYPRELLQLRYFDKVSISQEDRQRTTFYLNEKRRQEMLQAVPSLEDWLQTINLKVIYEELSSSNVSRAVQLLNRVNQFNLITRRMDKHEFFKLAQEGERKVWVFYASDRIGDYGMIGLTSCELDDHCLRIRDFILSCRAMGRGIEKAMLSLIAAFARENRVQKIVGQYIRTAKNAPCAEFLPDNGFKPSGNGFELVNLNAIQVPSYIQLEAKDAELNSFISPN